MLRLELIGSGLLAIFLICWVYARRVRRTKVMGGRRQPSAFDRGGFSSDETMPMAASISQTQPVVVGGRSPLDDTRPGQPVQVPRALKDDTEPRKPSPPIVVSIRARPTQPVRHYPDPTDPYANLFPPPRPGDEDYLESPADVGDTPPSGMKRADSTLDSPSDNLPDNLPL